MSRAAIPGLVSPTPIITQLPAVFQEDFFTERFTAGLDEVLAPVFLVLDCLEAYIDPHLTPPDFLEWLAGWFGFPPEEDWTEDRRRWLVANATHLFRFRGTAAGLQAELEVFSGGEVVLNESGGTAWSATPGGAFPGQDVPRLAVRVIVDDPASVSQTGLDAIVRANKPAHVVHSIEVVGRGGKG